MWTRLEARAARGGRQLPLLRRARVRHVRDRQRTRACTAGSFPTCATFLVFSDYARNALRMAALMKQRVIYVFTHDSIGLGEDGPTHQPVEHAATPAAHPEHGRLAAVRHDRNGRRVDRARSSAATDRPACCSAARTCAFQKRDDCDSSRRSRAAATCSAEASDGKAAIGHHRDRLGSRACDGRTRTARSRRHPRARRLDALDQRVRPAGRGVSRAVLPRGVAAARGRSGRERLLAQVCRPRGRGDRHRPLRRVRAGGGRVQVLRLHRGQRRGAGEKCSRA